MVLVQPDGDVAWRSGIAPADVASTLSVMAQILRAVPHSDDPAVSAEGLVGVAKRKSWSDT